MDIIQLRLYNDQLAWARSVVVIAKANLVRGKKIAAGTLYNSISFEIDTKGQVIFLADETADYVQGGRKPNSKFPPPPAIAQWAKVKGIPQFRDKKGRYISNDSRTFLLSRAIAKKGIRPFPFYDDAIDQAILQLVQSQEDALVLGIEETFEI
jgi:hypothetical protein